MKFSEMPYKRPNIKEVVTKLEEFNQRFKAATSAEEQAELYRAYNDFSVDFNTNYWICSIRNTIDTRDEFYEAENAFFDENMPLISTKNVEIAKTLVESPYRSELEELLGAHLFELMECSLVINEKAIPFMQKENELVTEYSKLIATAEVPFRGKIYTLTQMAPLLQNTDRSFRREAYEAHIAFFEKHEAEFDRIYDELVQVRTEMAQALGFENFVELRYKLMNRTDYNRDDVAKYREKVLKSITPLAVELRKKQAERLGIDDMKYYDRSLSFADGNAIPQGDTQFIVDNAQKMYRELSPETGRFFDFMVENELMDLEAKPGKRSGGYCTSLNKYKAPFIFSNFNGSKGDIDVITHEAGHAFQNFMAQEMPFEEYIWPTYEAAEIHSMSMEFLTWPWMNLFFGADADKFRYSALTDAICFIPYGCTIDHFQHFVYENPGASPEERKAAYHEIELMYQPDLDYDNEFFTKGTWWFKQGHVFASPFYYIDYTLAQVCAFQYLLKSLDDREKTLEEYITLCRAGGSESFFKLLGIGNIENPMTSSVLEDITPRLLEVAQDLEEKSLR